MNISNNIRKLAQLFVVFFIALSAVLVYWQVVVAQQVTSNIHNNRHCLSDSAPVRGRIFDRNGVLLAESKPSNVAVCGYQRYYYLKNYPSLASLIGYYISPLYGSSGIEHQYDDYLSGRVGVTGLNNYINQTLHRPPVGDDIYLTIDVRMQALLEKYFDQDVPPPDGVNIFPSDRGSAIIANPYTVHFPVNLRYGYTHSDNIIFAQVGAKMGASTWLDYNNRFYVGRQIPFDLPVKVSTVTPGNGQSLKVNQLAENSFGQGIDLITPMQMTMIDNSIANNGQLMRPTLVQKVVDPDGATVFSASPQPLGSPISDNTASQVRDAMYGVVQCGSGRFGPTAALAPQLDTSPWAIIAKTGTGQVPQVNGKTRGAEAWLLTQAPYQNPQLTIVAMRENAGEGGSAVGPMVTHTYNDIFSKIMKIPTSPPADPNYCATTGLLQ